MNNYPLISIPPIDKMRKDFENLNIPQGKIVNGYGEYVVYKKSGDKKEIPEESYQKVFSIFEKYSFPNIALKEPTKEEISNSCQNRDKVILNEIKKIDSDFELIFVPRTLYELVFIHKCIQEDWKAKEDCAFLYKNIQELFRGIATKKPTQHEENQLESAKKPEKLNKCWHFCYLSDKNKNQESEIMKIAYKLNNVIVKKIFSVNSEYDYKKISLLVENEIKYLQEFNKNFMDLWNQKRRGVNNSLDKFEENVVKHFGCNTHWESMAIEESDPKQGDIVRKAVSLECSTLGQKSILLFRGTSLKKDLPYDCNNKNHPYSVSYGTSLFAGAVFDPGANAFSYIRKEENNGYVVPVPVEEYFQAPFYIPSTNSIIQLFAEGELFHARSKAWEDSIGIDGSLQGVKNDERRTEYLECSMSREELITEFSSYLSNGFLLHSASNINDAASDYETD